MQAVAYPASRRCSASVISGRWQALYFLGDEHPRDAGSERMTPGQDRGPCRGAGRRRRVKLRQADPLGCHPVQGRGPDLGIAVAAKVAVSEVVGDDQHEVRPVGRSRGRRDQARKDRAQQSRPAERTGFKQPAIEPHTLIPASRGSAWPWPASAAGSRSARPALRHARRTRRESGRRSPGTGKSWPRLRSRPRPCCRCESP